jgi:GT2 family glycosyltransferase
VISAAHPENLGFCAANNLGGRLLPPTDYVLFLNPDAVVGPGFVSRAVAVLEAHPRAAALNPKLVQIDADTLEPTGRIDCAGVFQTWYGRSYDRGQGEIDDGRYDGPPEDVPALCAAAMLCRRAALDSVAPDGRVFDEAFFMYKEDVDLSYRLHAAGWDLLHVPELVVGHVRGAHAVAADPLARRRLRRRSLSNDWRVWRKGLMPAHRRAAMLGYLLAKTIRVRVVPWRLQ